MTISLVIVTDGARLGNLRRAIDSVKPVINETVIVYQGNDEGVFKEISSMADFCIQTTAKGNADPDRNFAYGLATQEWILALDDDEWVSAELLAKIPRIAMTSGDVIWFKFRNLVDGIDIKEILGEDPHPRMWRNRPNLIIWPDKAHTFPQINSPLQYFCSQEIVHDRVYDDLYKRHQKRVPTMEPQNVQLETNFINALKRKLGK